MLHTELMAHDTAKIREAVTSNDHPLVVVIPREGMTPAEGQALLRASGLWFVKD